MNFQRKENHNNKEPTYRKKHASRSRQNTGEGLTSELKHQDSYEKLKQATLQVKKQLKEFTSGDSGVKQPPQKRTRRLSTNSQSNSKSKRKKSNGSQNNNAMKKARKIAQDCLSDRSTRSKDQRSLSRKRQAGKQLTNLQSNRSYCHQTARDDVTLDQSIMQKSVFSTKSSRSRSLRASSARAGAT